MIRVLISLRAMALHLAERDEYNTHIPLWSFSVGSLGMGMNPINYYYLQVPTRPRPVSQSVEFLPVHQWLEDEESCKRFWDLLTTNFHTRSKFLSTWPNVRFVAVHKRVGRLAGFLLVSTGINWQIDYVTVVGEFRGQGIAEALVNETINQALARKVPYVMLTSLENLRSFYEGRCGFTVVADNRTV